MHIYRVCPAKPNSGREARNGKQRASFYPVTPDKSGVNYGRGRGGAEIDWSACARDTY